jgi:nitrate reductase NapE component
VKKSYYVTPRNLGDCSFSSWADPIERPARRAPIATTAVVVFVLFLIVAATVVGAV